MPQIGKNQIVAPERNSAPRRGVPPFSDSECLIAKYLFGRGQKQRSEIGVICGPLYILLTAI